MERSVQFSHSVMSDSLWPHGLQYARRPYPSPAPGACSSSCPSSPWCHLTISSSVVPFSSCLQSFPASGSFPVSQFFTSDGQSIGASASASVLPMNIQDWFPLGLAGLISLQSKGLLRVFSNTTVQKHQWATFGLLVGHSNMRQSLESVRRGWERPGWWVPGTPAALEHRVEGHRLQVIQTTQDTVAANQLFQQCFFINVYSC